MAHAIGWTDKTWNPVTGCSPVSEGCANCYAKPRSRRLRGRYGYPADDPFRVTCHADRLDKPSEWGKPQKVFLCSMGDLFHADVPDSFIDRVMRRIEFSEQHTFQLLTKRADRMQRYFQGLQQEWGATVSRVLPNLWLGVTAENQRTFDERVPALLGILAAVRFISFEPLLEPIFTRGYLRRDWPKNNGGIQWGIVGCETGPGRRPMRVEWARGVVQQLHLARVAAWVKQLDLGDRVSKDPDDWTEDLRVRQFPH